MTNRNSGLFCNLCKRIPIQTKLQNQLGAFRLFNCSNKLAFISIAATNHAVTNRLTEEILLNSHESRI